VVGVDVVELVVRANARPRSDGTRLLCQSDSMSELFTAGEIADKAEAAGNFVMDKRFGVKCLRIGSETPMAGWPAAEIAAKAAYLTDRRKTMTATSRVSRSVTRRPETNFAFDAEDA